MADVTVMHLNLKLYLLYWSKLLHGQYTHHGGCNMYIIKYNTVFVPLKFIVAGAFAIVSANTKKSGFVSIMLHIFMDHELN